MAPVARHVSARPQRDPSIIKHVGTLFFPFFRGLFVLSEIFFHQIPRLGLPRKRKRCFVLQQPKTRFASDLYLHRVVLLHALRNIGARAHVLERVCEGRVFLRLRCEG